MWQLRAAWVGHQLHTCVSRLLTSPAPAGAHSAPSPLPTRAHSHSSPCKLPLRHVNSSRQPAHTRSSGLNSAADEKRKTLRRLVPNNDDHWQKPPFLPMQTRMLKLTQGGSGFSLYPEQLKAKSHYNVDFAMQI